MRKVLHLLGLGKGVQPKPEEAVESQFFTTGFHDPGATVTAVPQWMERAPGIGARKLSRAAPSKRLKELWGRDRYMAGLSVVDLDACARHFEFYGVDSNRDMIEQNEYGAFMLVVLHGIVAVDRQQPWGDRLRLTEARAGSVLGEMSLLDSGPRWSYCTTLTECEVAVLDAASLDAMIQQAPAAAARLVGSLARRLSLRLRKLGTNNVVGS